MWPTIILTPINVVDGYIIVSSTKGLHPKQEISLTLPGLPVLNCEIKRIFSPTQITVGESKQSIRGQFDQAKLSPYIGGTLTSFEQPRNAMGMEPAIRAVYAEEPTVALRSHLVDYWGNSYDETNPIPIKIESLNDSVLVLGTEDGNITGTQHVLKVGPDLNLRVKDEDATLLLSDISSKLTNPIDIRDLNADQDDVMIAGSINGLSSGDIYHFVYNLRQQILATHDRQQSITYADFGTKDERITSITYTSPTFPGHTAIKTMTYTLIGGKYRRDSINWSIT